MGEFVHFNVYLDEKMGVQLNKALKKEGGKTRNALIREAIQSWLSQRGGMWPKEVLLFKGIPNAPLFEQYREHLLPPKEESWL